MQIVGRKLDLDQVQLVKIQVLVGIARHQQRRPAGSIQPVVRREDAQRHARLVQQPVKRLTDREICCDGFVERGDGAHGVWFNDGQGNFRDSGETIGGPSSSSVALGDLDGDGDLDAFEGNSAPHQSTHVPAGGVWLNDGHGAFADSGQRLGNFRTTAVELGDLDNDGDLDALVANL